jgi:hypothetical protein
MTAIEVGLAPAGTGVATGLQGEIVALITPNAFAPGQPLTFTLPVEHGGAEIQGKSLGSKRRADGQFDVRVRLINVHRSMRERLVALFS